MPSAVDRGTVILSNPNGVTISMNVMSKERRMNENAFSGVSNQSNLQSCENK